MRSTGRVLLSRLRTLSLHEEQAAEVVEQFWVVLTFIPPIPILPHLIVHLVRPLLHIIVCLLVVLVISLECV